MALANMYGVRLAPPKAKASLSVAIALIVVLVSLIGPATSQGAFPGANGKIAFHSFRDPIDPNLDSNTEIYTLNADGSSRTQLTNNGSEDVSPAWSPDGTKIAFRGWRDGNAEIYTMNADGSNPTRLTFNTHPQNDSGPAWSPDGTKIAFVTDRDGSTYEVYTMNADGSNQTRLTNNSVNDLSPAWSPDGTKIAFGTLRFFSPYGYSYEIHTMNADGTGETPITSNTFDYNPDWSPDGTKIAFVSLRDEPDPDFGDNYEIYTMNPDGSGQTRLTNNTSADVNPAWSPDGTKIAFVTNRDGNAEIYTMNADGTNQTRLTNNTIPDSSPDWQPVAAPGGYPRPAGATPTRVALVPAFQKCTAPNRMHGQPLAHPSCNPAVLESSQLIVGTPEVNGQPVAASGFARYTTIAGVPGGVDDADVRFAFRLTDVRLKDTLADYTGELGVASVVRITDRLGGPAGEAGTVTDFQHRVTVPCAATGGAIGATCSTSTTFDAIVPGAIKEGKHAVWQLGQVRVNDGGPDGLASTTPNTLFAVQGVFVP